MRGEIEATLLSLYEAKPYHNALHAIEVRDRALKFAELAASQGRGVDFEAVELAALGHDACFGADYRRAGFTSMEEMSANVCVQVLIGLGVSRDTADTVKTAILATHPQGTLRTVEAKILRAADLGGLADDYEEGFDRLMSEIGAKDARQFYLESLKLLMRYLWPEIRLSDGFYNLRGASGWHNRVLDNLVGHFRRLFDEPVVLEVGAGANPIVLQMDTPGLVIGVEPDETARKDAVIILSGAEKRELIVPGRGDAIPLSKCPDEMLFVNTALIRPEAVCLPEINRLLCPNGTVSVVESYTPWIWTQMDSAKALQRLDSQLALFQRYELESAAGLPHADQDAFIARYRRCP